MVVVVVRIRRRAVVPGTSRSRSARWRRGERTQGRDCMLTGSKGGSPSAASEARVAVSVGLESTTLESRSMAQAG